MKNYYTSSFAPIAEYSITFVHRHLPNTTTKMVERIQALVQDQFLYLLIDKSYQSTNNF